MKGFVLKKTWKNSHKDFRLVIGQSIRTYGQFPDVLIDIGMCHYLCNIRKPISLLILTFKSKKDEVFPSGHRTKHFDDPF